MDINLKRMLDDWVVQFNHVSFIPDDPISIPHRFTKQQDIEIAGLFAALFAWGNRTTIKNKCLDLLNRMDHAPHAFVSQYSDRDLQRLEGFVHRTFNDTDLLFLIAFLKAWYTSHDSLEQAFSDGLTQDATDIRQGIIHFRQQVISLANPMNRTLKHVSTPESGSACKRINMYLRWMVRKDDAGVDFGIWNHLLPRQLVCPLDVHVHRTALNLGLLQPGATGWKAAAALTEQLKQYDPDDPVKYDFALFGISINKN